MFQKSVANYGWKEEWKHVNIEHKNVCVECGACVAVEDVKLKYN